MYWMFYFFFLKKVLLKYQCRCEDKLVVCVCVCVTCVKVLLNKEGVTIGQQRLPKGGAVQQIVAPGDSQTVLVWQSVATSRSTIYRSAMWIQFHWVSLGGNWLFSFLFSLIYCSVTSIRPSLHAVVRCRPHSISLPPDRPEAALTWTARSTSDCYLGGVGAFIPCI